jgi:ribosome-associated protein
MGKKRKASEAEPLVKCIVDAILEKKGKEVTSLEIGTLPNAVCDYFIICHADSTTQVNAIAENIEVKVRESLNEKVWKSAGYDNSIWIVLDFVNVVVHVFQTEWRSFYKIEELWADAQAKYYTDETEPEPKQTKARAKRVTKQPFQL